MAKAWRFYVYEIVDGETVKYIGKGSGTRLAVQVRKFGLEGREVARFKREEDAYAFEVLRIAEVSPHLNKCAGGNGSRVTVKRDRKDAWTREVERIGTRAYAARLILAFGQSFVAKSKLEDIRRIAYG